jgi:hypothetical protein
MKLAAMLTTGLCTLIFLASSGVASQPSPTVLCKKPTVPGHVKVTDPGIYSREPRTCILNYFEAPAPNAVFVPIRAIDWKRWDSESAYGLGTILIPRERPGGPREGWSHEPAKVTLSRPREVCGHDVFTAARIFWVYGPFDEHTRLDPVPVVGRGC